MPELAASSDPLMPLGDHPLVTVVVSSYDQEDYIQDTIDSVLNQDYENIELIVIDGGSTDCTMEIVRAYEDPRIRWISEPDDGPNHAMVKGMKMARGDILGLLTSSDTYQAGALAAAVKEFKADSQLAFVGGGIVWEIDSYGRPNGTIWRTIDQSFYYSVDEIVKLNNYPAVQSTFFRSDIAQTIQGAGLEFKWLHTFFFLRYMLESSKLGARSLCVPLHWSNYRRHPNARHQILANKDVNLEVCQEHNLACKQISQEYSDFLTPVQVRELRRPGYLAELRYRVGTLHQIIPAIPALWGYFRFGGNLGGRDLRPQRKGWLQYLASFMLGWFLHRVSRSRAIPCQK